MFSFKETLGQKILVYLSLPDMEMLPLLPRIIPILKILGQQRKDVCHLKIIKN